MYATGSTVIPPLGLKKVDVQVTNDGVYMATSVNSMKIIGNIFKAVMDSIIALNT